MSLRWYALNSQPRTEARVAETLERLYSEKPLETYLPLWPDTRMRESATATPLFPGYLFVRCDLSRLSLAEMRRASGFRSLVTFGNSPAVVQDEAIALVKNRLGAARAEGGFRREWFTPGETLQVNSGPLSGLLAVFDGPIEPSDRARVLVEFLGRTSRVTMPASSLERGIHPPRRTRGRGRAIVQRAEC